MTRLRRSLALFGLLVLPNGLWGADINFITPSDLPRTTERSYVENGRGNLPDYKDGYGIGEALASTEAENACMAKTSKQLTPWKTEKSQVWTTWTYKISAEFECLAPTISKKTSGDSAKRFFDDMAGLSVASVNGSNQKESSVLCYWTAEEVVTSQNLTTMRSQYICELGDSHNGGKVVRLEDITEDGTIDETVLQDQGARRLTSDLPVYIDYRRADLAGQAGGTLKGVWRQAANVVCSQDADGGATSCRIDGMIDTSR